MKLLKHIQKKSSDTKTQYAFFVALFITFVIAVVWSTTLPTRFSSIGPDTGEKDEKTKDSKTFAEIFEEAKSQVGNIADFDIEKEEEIETNSLDALGMNDEYTEFNEDEEIEKNFESDTVVGSAISDEVEVAKEEPRTVLIEIRKSEDNENSENANDPDGIQ